MLYNREIHVALRHYDIESAAMISDRRILRAARLLALFFALGLAFVPQDAASRPAVTVLSFGLFGDQSVFESEAKGAARIVASRFGGGSVVVRFNSKKSEDATPETLAATLQSAAKTMDADNDILFLILTSHGSRAGLAVKAGARQATLSPLDLVTMLGNTPVRHRVVIISACYSGIFIHPLADPDTLIITAADADHPSFGCRNGNEWTYFGDAFFNGALRRTTSLKDAFALASASIRKRELQGGLVPSNPQMAGGENIERMLRGDATPEQGDAVSVDQKYAPAAAARGDAYGNKGDYERAVAAYGEAIRLDPKYALAYTNRGLVYRLKGDLERAIADGNEAIRLDPSLALAYNGRGIAYGAKGELDRAVADFNEAIRLDPKLFVAYGNRGFAYRTKGDLDRAIADFSAAIRLEPRYAQAYNNRGVAYGAKGDNDRAIADYSQAIKLDPKSPSAYSNRALAYRAKGELDRANADVNEAARLKALAQP
jgi:tetratricopeptide (TPR) repeat protein